MNCPQCQERLDERLDGLRSDLQSGALSPSNTRQHAQSALEETVRECGDCEAQLRAHVQVRLALMIPAQGETQVVPPALRANVRRALERDARRPLASSWRPMMNFAWTGGALLSALGLFLIARPILLQRAQEPMMTSAESRSSSVATPPSSVATPPSSVVTPPSSVAPTTRPKARALPAKPPVPGSSSASKPAPKSSEVQVAPPPPDTRTAPATSQQKQKPFPHLEVRAPSPRPKSNGESGNLSRPVPPSPGAVELPPVGAGAPPHVMAKRAFSRSSAPSPAPTDTALLSVPGAELGLKVRFVAAPSASKQHRRTGAVRSAGSVQPPMVGSAAPADPVQKVPSTPAPAAPVGARPPEEAPNTNDSSPTLTSRNSKPTESGSSDEASSSEVQRDAARLQPKNSSKAGDTLSVSIEHDVANARIVGRVQGRMDDGVELWAGDAVARESISVSLTPLHPASGDTVLVAMEQKLAEGKTKPLATTSVVVP